ncbi:ABC-type multidrug transport system, ATPase component [Methanocella conradii HZ254]|uniref:ABC-type multidrug transport system, ATPase component n=1 Tax=Methanocella conradii (strain DSM 24694 / JCM 17849 / CGMCC 1.5162 / HZ254) TaxID=1041930 RepID=H8I782_METCZ|nr:ABC transporter ATP-binding protein [Methanocella conradii]AFD00333.1 ABC-type multidrug transport system, ATPase component [Methanocella conradii HZ254]
MIEARNVIKRYGSVKALDGFEMSVEKNTVHAIIGPNSSGKTTAIRILSTAIRPDSGEVSIDGISISNVREIRAMISVVPELQAIPDNKPPRKLLEGAGKAAGLSREEVKYRIDVLAELMGIQQYLDKKVVEASRGIKRRVALSIALINDASVILMDGSLAELDPGFSAYFLNFLKESRDKTVVLTTNNISLIEKACDSVTIIKEGATLMNESMSSIRGNIGRPGVMLRVSPINIPKVESVLKNQIYANRIQVGEDYLLIEVDDYLHIPAIIRQASAFADVYEARQTLISLEDIYNAFIEPST